MTKEFHKTVNWHERRVQLDTLKEALGIPKEENLEQIVPATEDGLVWRLITHEGPVEPEA